MGLRAPSRRWTGRLGGCLAALLVLSWNPAAARTQNDVTLTAEQVKAAFLYNFTKYTSWPTTNGERGVLRICVLQAPEVAAELEHSIDGKFSGDRMIRVRRMNDAAGVGGCDVVFAGDISRSEQQRLFAALASMPVLTVGEPDDFLSAGMIRFVLQGDRLRFDMNLAAARKANIRFDSRLVALARNRVEARP